MTNTLAGPSDLTGFPGAPFTDRVVDGAVGALRLVARWHIAPSVTETITLDSDGGSRLILPTLHLTAVSEVRDVSGDTPVVITDFRWSHAGVLSRPCGWPYGFQSIEVDITHGYTECPPELLSIIAYGCQSAGVDRNLSARSVGPFSESYRDSAGEVSDPILARYTLPTRP